MLDAATAPTATHLDPTTAGDVVKPSTDLTAAYAEEPVTFTSVLDLPRRVVAHVAQLHEQHFIALGTRPGRRALSAREQSLAFCRVMLEDVEPDQLARDTGIARSTAHLRTRESEQIVAAQAPDLPAAVDAARTDPQLLAEVDRWRQDGRTVLADLGYEGEATRLLVPVKADANGSDRDGELVPLTPDQQTHNALHSATRARAEAGNAQLKQTFTALRHVRVDP